MSIEDISLAELTEQVRSKMEPLARNKGLKFNVVFKENSRLSVQNDPLRLQQIMINLVGNALKFTEQGYVQIEVDHINGQQWGFDVIDSGPGISPSKLAEIFEPFKQVDGSATRSKEGTGLGLSITKQIVELMRGQIFVRSIEGEGACFSVRLPYAPS